MRKNQIKIYIKKIKILLLVCSIKQYSFENSIDNSSIQILIFNLRLLFVTKEKTIPPAIFPILPCRWGEYPLPLNAIWKTLPVEIHEQNFVEHSQVLELFVTGNPVLNLL